jgi:hypothetical protein
MASKPLDALIKSGLIGSLLYEADMVFGPKSKAGTPVDKHVTELRELIELAWKAHRSHFNKAEKVKWGIK